MLKRSAGDLVTEANQSVTTLTADDPQSQAFRPEIGNAERLVLYCGSGDAPLWPQKRSRKWASIMSPMWLAAFRR